MVSLNVTVHVVVPAGSPVAVTTGRRVIELSELTVTLAFQFASPRFQVLVPLVAPLQLKVTLLTLVKLVPVAERVAT